MLCSSKKFERMVREATDICLRVLKESNKSRFDSFSRYEPCIDHIPYYLSGLSRAHFFRRDNLSRNSCIFDSITLEDKISEVSLHEISIVFVTKIEHAVNFSLYLIYLAS